MFRYFDSGALLESSLVISIGSTALSLLIGVAGRLCPGALGKPTRDRLAYFFLIIRTVPPVATLIPFYC